jgi:hypothetical protein
MFTFYVTVQTGLESVYESPLFLHKTEALGWMRDEMECIARGRADLWRLLGSDKLPELVMLEATAEKNL